jgi:hypothetical protein
MKWMLYSWVGLLALVVVGCEQEVANQANNAPPGAVTVKLVNWTEVGADYHAFSEREFLGFALGTLKDLPLPPHTQSVLYIKGGLDIVDGNGTLILEAHMNVPGVPGPIKTGIAALSSVKNGVTARAFVEKGVGDLRDAFKGLLVLVNADQDQLIRALDSAEPDEQVLACTLLGNRKVLTAVPAIGNLLDDPREQVIEAAAEALAQIGDEKAVPFLINGMRRRNLRSEVRAIEAMGRIGGREAEAYLEMTAMGHEVPEVRILSKSLLQKLSNRKMREQRVR